MSAAEPLVYRNKRWSDEAVEGEATATGDQAHNRRHRTPHQVGPSCQALRNAVAALNRLDDFNCEKIGAGFFSEVFKVTHRTSGQVMVLKMNMSHSNRPNMLREVQLMNRLCHPNILRFMGVCVHEGQLHALTEYINGGSLEQLLLNKMVNLVWKVRIELAQDIAKGVAYLHSKGVFHRDLTSKNVLIKQDEWRKCAVVGDFGLAEKIPDPLSNIRLPTVGSPYWMAPECLKGKWYNEKADVFSYGIILCEIIARVEADPDYLPRTENFGLDYIAFSEMCPDCPPDFLQLAFICCMVDPKQRPSFAEIVDRLEIILSRNPINLFEAKVREGNNSTTTTSSSSTTTSTTTTTKMNKIVHRRTKSEDTLLAPSNGFTTPSDKARCHYNTRTRMRSSDSDDIAQTTRLITPKHVGEVMSMGDPYYRPGSRNLNPFAALPQLNGCKKILASSRDLFSSCFELPSPAAAYTPPRSPTNASNGHCQLSRSNSLPDSPTLLRQMVVRMKSCGDDKTANSSSTSSSPCSSNSHPRSISVPDETTFYSSTNADRTSYDECLVYKNPVASPKILRRRGSCESGFFSVGDGEHLSPEMTVDDANGSLAICLTSSPRSSVLSTDTEFESMDGGANVESQHLPLPLPPPPVDCTQPDLSELSKSVNLVVLQEVVPRKTIFAQEIREPKVEDELNG